MSFVLPDALYARVPRGRFQPSLHRCVTTVHGAGLVSIVGPDLDTLREQARRFLRAHTSAALALAATATGPGGARQALRVTNAPRRRTGHAAPLLPLFDDEPEGRFG